MNTRSQQIAELTQVIQRRTALLVQARKDQQRICDELREARVQLFKLEIEEELEPTFLQIPPKAQHQRTQYD